MDSVTGVYGVTGRGVEFRVSASHGFVRRFRLIFWLRLMQGRWTVVTSITTACLSRFAGVQVFEP